jgi:hypothetical protein
MKEGKLNNVNRQIGATLVLTNMKVDQNLCLTKELQITESLIRKDVR